MRILVQQLNGETFELEITPEMTMRAVKEQLKRMQKWEDELSRDTTVVEVILGDKKVTNEETVEELGLCKDAKVSVVFRKNVVRCRDKSCLGLGFHPECLVIVEIPESETEIKALAFEHCWHVAKVIIPSSVTQIGERSFRYGYSLAAITIPDSVTRIGEQAFFGCSSLVNVNIPDSVTLIGNCAFGHCSSLAAIYLPNSLTQIGEDAFCGCTSLVAINIQDSTTLTATQIGAYAFSYCTSLTSVDIPDSVTEIGTGAFHNCKQLTLTAPARLLGPHVLDVYKVVAKECRCGRCDWTLFCEGWVCPKRHRGSRSF